MYYFTVSSDRIIKEIYQCVDNSEPIGVICKTLLNANTIYKDLKDRYPNKNIKLYTSKTSNKVKEEEYGNVNKFWTEADVLIYTPTITAGLSYEIKHFKKLFLLFDTNEGCDINTCIQMSGRIRDVGEHQFFVLLKPSMRYYYPEKVSEVYEQMKTNRKLLFSSGLDFKFDNDGNISFYETDYFWLYIANQSNKNKSYNDFNIRLIQRIASNGASVHYIDNEGSQNYLDIRKGTFMAKCDAIASAKDITEIEAMNIYEKLADNQDVSVDELNSYEKFELKEFYKVNNLSCSSVATLYPRSTHETFKRLAQIKHLGLEGIRNEERDNFMRNMKNENKLVGESRDLNRNYEYQNHFVAQMVMRHCGFDGLDDDKKVSDLNLQKLDELKPLIENNFGFRMRDSMRSRLMIVNKILGKVYGAKIKRKDNEYRIVLSLTEKLNEFGVVI
ncbi:Origin of replication binding protein [uncultured archaeon]|nr:Origin of replication binding protein [uncultured archaeon]